MRVAQSKPLGCGCGGNVATEDQLLGSQVQASPVDAGGNACPIIDDAKIAAASKEDLEDWKAKGCLSKQQLEEVEGRLKRFRVQRMKWLLAGAVVIVGAIAVIAAVTR